jgi:hypothetical protein
MNHEGTVSLDRIAQILIEKGVAKAFVDQTGGGVATLFAGEGGTDSAGDERYALIAGPGYFAGPGWSNARVAVCANNDFGYGPNDDGESAPLYVNEGDEATIAQRFYDFIQEQRRGSPDAG